MHEPQVRLAGERDRREQEQQDERVSRRQAAERGRLVQAQRSKRQNDAETARRSQQHEEQQDGVLAHRPVSLSTRRHDSCVGVAAGIGGRSYPGVITAQGSGRLAPGGETRVDRDERVRTARYTPAMKQQRVIVVIPAYNAATTLERVYADIPHDIVHEVLVVDDCSKDDTVRVAERLPVTVIRHPENVGYGGTQKTCYDEALSRGADIVVMLHGDYQYDGRMIGPASEIIRFGNCDVVLGNRIRTRREALAGGMPKVKYFANRGLTILENLVSGQNLGEWHSGFRAYSRAVLETIPYHRNSSDFVFDSQFLVQAVHFGFKLGDLPVPVRYFDEASSISVGDASRYAISTIGTFLTWYGHKTGLRPSPLFRS